MPSSIPNFGRFRKLPNEEIKTRIAILKETFEKRTDHIRSDFKTSETKVC